MQPHQERVVAEKKELDDKIDKLKKFIDGSIYAGLEKEDQHLLSVQYEYMNSYSSILSERIARF